MGAVATCEKLVLGKPRQAVLGCDVWDTGDEKNHSLDEEGPQKIRNHWLEWFPKTRCCMNHNLPAGTPGRVFHLLLYISVIAKAIPSRGLKEKESAPTLRS
ncbi:hypothetical protein [Paenibacillus sp. GP183]|uniref:hypothetical protein n=1 Tax=Paenibacillus sp. GP183 TaxID=1882751 RepID=UPI000895302F|nr:hypothetical protein [Paenibacillus sp. GP183]SED17856.1 hypothetical protein SAMN05443246_5967 [Paenibacillus sp. GP183]